MEEVVVVTVFGPSADEANRRPWDDATDQQLVNEDGRPASYRSVSTCSFFRLSPAVVCALPQFPARLLRLCEVPFDRSDRSGRDASTLEKSG